MTGFIPYGRQSITQEDIDKVVAVLKSDYLTGGPEIDEFESDLAEKLGCSATIACSNGTAALHLAYMALSVTQGDAVIVPPLTFAATANAVLYCGGTPVFADIDTSTGGLCPHSVRDAVALAKRKGLKPKAVTVVHYGGFPAGISELAAVCKDHQMALVEDACHALGAEYRTDATSAWLKVGSGRHAVMSCFSFHPVKHVATGEGGAVSTDSAELAAKLRMLRTHGITKDPSEYVESGKYSEATYRGPWYHQMQLLGYNYRLTDVQAALGRSQLSRLSNNVARRRVIADTYRRELGGLGWLGMPPADSNLARGSYHLFPVKFNYSDLRKSKTEVFRALGEQGVGTQVHYIPVYCHPYYQNHPEQWLAVPCENAEKHYESSLSIPMYHGMSDDDVERVISAIKRLPS